MRILIVSTLLVLTLASCAKVSVPTVSSEAKVPTGIRIDSGSLYPSMPLEDFQKMQSGTTSTGATPASPSAL